ncbi:MAG: hypothetical protein AAB367_01835 [Patescibacteria group bacterium]
MEIRKNGPTGCAGCPCGCTGCVFALAPEPTAQGVRDVILNEEDYGCRFGGELVRLDDGAVGLLREQQDFHALTPEGLAFMTSAENPLLDLIGPQ